MCCGWLPAEASKINRFSPRPRLCSLFGLRVGAAGGYVNSTTYARGFVVNQGGQACFEALSTLAQAPILLYHETSRRIMMRMT